MSDSTPRIDSGSRRRRRSLAVLVGAGLSVASWMGVVSVQPSAAAAGKITICHRTHSTTNPYRRITVSQNAVQSARHGGHGLPNGSANPAVYDPTFTYASNNKYWADIIPGGDSAGLLYNGSNAIALNWTVAGKAAFVDYCGAMSPTQFYDAEIAAGQTQANVIADLNEQAANEDAALLAALGGSFTTGNLATWTTAVTVTTDAASLVTTSTATLNGSLNVGSTSTLPKFQYGTSPTLDISTTVGATPTPVTNTTAVSADVTGLALATTYYFRVTGTTNAGTDTEGILLGVILSFTTSAASTTTTVPASTTTTTVPESTTSTTTVPESTTTTSTTVPESTTSTTTTVPESTTSTTTTVPESTSTTSTVPEPTTTVPESTTTSVVISTTTSNPAPSSSTPGTSDPTSTSSAPTASPDGSVRGVVWFDRNGNGAFDTNEWVLPGVVVTLDDAPTPPQTVPGGAASAPRRAVTAADGSYFFGGVAVGNHQVAAAATIRGFDYTSDSDGATDWTVALAVVQGASASANFAGLGRGEVIGQVFESATLQGLGGAMVQCNWSGFDDLAGTADDVTFTVIADSAGSFDLAGVPYGVFSCTGTDQQTARASSPAIATVFSPEAVAALLPLGTQASPLAAPRGTLPRTGTESSDLVMISLLALMGGFAAMVIARRAPRRQPDVVTLVVDTRRTGS